MGIRVCVISSSVAQPKASSMTFVCLSLCRISRRGSETTHSTMGGGRDGQRNDPPGMPRLTGSQQSWTACLCQRRNALCRSDELCFRGRPYLQFFTCRPQGLGNEGTFFGLPGSRCD